MRVIEAPNRITRKNDEICLFLGGGISGCPNWQRELINDSRLNDSPLVILNPRRVLYPSTDQFESETQIGWEFRGLQMSNIIVFYFPKETVCPIALYELGFQFGRKYCDDTETPIVIIGTHPEYSRRIDVETQCRIVLPDVKILNSLDEIIEELMDAIEWF